MNDVDCLDLNLDDDTLAKLERMRRGGRVLVGVDDKGRILGVRDVEEEVYQLREAARHAARLMAAAPTAAKNAALLAMARRLRAAGPALAKANAMDIKAAKAGGLKGPMLDRLKPGTAAPGGGQ